MSDVEHKVRVEYGLEETDVVEDNISKKAAESRRNRKIIKLKLRCRKYSETLTRKM